VRLPPELTSDDALVAVGRVLRTYHDDQDPDPAAIVVCHNDVRPETVVLTDGRPTGLLPSPWAAPGTRLWDVAGAVWRWVPLLCDWDTAELGFDDGLDRRGERLHAFVDAYGLAEADRRSLLDEVELRLEVADAVRLDERFAGIAGWQALRDERAGEGVLRDRWFVAEFRDRLEPHN
jgi:hypothetical protein